MKLLKDVFSFMQNNFRGRLFRAYVLNAPWTFSTVYSGIKVFMEDSTASKIVVTSDSTDKLIETHINLQQLEIKFGGKSPDIVQFWPPKLPEGDFFVPTNPTRLVSPEEYKQLHQSGKLSGCKPSPYIN